MTLNRKGFAAIANNTFTSTFGSNLKEALIEGHNEIFVGRVTDIILDSSHPKFKNFGEWNGIGTIFIEAQGNEFVGSDNIVVKPFTPQRSSFPLVNEMVLIFTLPNKEQGQSPTSKEYYYINVISIWNSPHHNAYPNPILTTDLPPSQQKDYQQTQAGSVRRVTDKSTEIDLNSPINPSQQTFREQSNIHPLLPFAGDIIYEGRFGNSIRLGGTARPPIPFIPLNDWSNNGENGNPITIIRNGQNPNSSDEGWIPTVENINDDLSSIYATSNQQIPIGVSNEDYKEYSTPPTSPSAWVKPQVIINSDRLVLNAKTDSILLSGEKSVGLFSNNSINFGSKSFTVDSTDIKLGANNASESLILGDKFLSSLKNIMEALDGLCDSLQGLQNWPEGKPVPNSSVSLPAGNLQGLVQNFNSQIENFKSTVSKTK
jgi:glutaredoxin-related protein